MIMNDCFSYLPFAMFTLHMKQYLVKSESVSRLAAVHREHLQGAGPDGRVGLLRRVQQDLRGGAVCGGRAGQDHSGRRAQQEAEVS